ncbi:MAG TPA: NDP-sugar synthase [Vicinamibacterales bacterium]|nr:NDP-sugar synthase [Vicinamibacterales bacterium]
MRALVLTAGLGTRLQPLTLARAKAAAPVDGEPLARRTISWLVSHGIRDLVLNLYYKPESITAAVGDGTDLGARVRYSWESPVLGSAGGPRHALPLLLDGTPERTFLLVNGDTLTNVDVPAMVAQHRRSAAVVTMALIPNPNPDKYGGVLLDQDRAVTGFTRRGNPEPSFHFIGPQVVEADAFSWLADGVPAESVLEVYPKLMDARPGSVKGFVSDSAFHDIGTPADLLQTSLELAAADGRPDRPRWGPHVRVAESARVTRSVLWDEVTVGAGATITECVLADRVVIPDGVEYRRRAIVNGPNGLVIAKLD